MVAETALLKRTTLPALSMREELALLARILWQVGYDDHQVGHMTYREQDGTFLTLPLALGWNEVTASDVLRMDETGRLLDGSGTVPEPTLLHLEYHRANPGTRVTLHQHPRFATVWSTAGELPAVYDQLSGLLADDQFVLYDDYDGTAAELASVRRMVDAIGRARCAILRNHGVFVVGQSIPEAYLNAVVLEWRCRQAWYVETLGRAARAMPAVGREAIERGVAKIDVATPKWEWAVRRELGLIDSPLA